MAVRDYLASHRNRDNGLMLANGYANKVDQLTNGIMRIDGSAVLEAVSRGQYQPHFE